MTRRLAPILLCCVLPAPARAEIVAQNEQVFEPPAPAQGDAFGASVTMEGALAAVGAPGRDVAGPADSGAAYVYARSGGVWSADGELLPGLPAAGGDFGRSLDLSQESLLVGAPGESSAGQATGAAYVYTRSGTAWSQAARLVPQNGADGGEFGAAVAIYGNRALIGAPGDAGDGRNAGAVHVFGRFGSSWQEINVLRGNSGNPAGDRFGAALDLVGNLAAVGAPGSDAGGFLYVFESGGSGFQQTRRLQTNEPPGPALGASVLIDGDRIVVGGPDNLDPGFYVTERSGTSWSTLEKIVADPDDVLVDLGAALAVDGARTFVGVPEASVWEPPLEPRVVGRVDVFERVGGQTLLAGRLERGDTARFGTSLASGDDVLLVGDPLGGVLEQGQATFLRPVEVRPVTIESSVLSPSAPIGIGTSLSVTGDTLVVGAPFPFQQGGAIVWTRVAGTWSESAILAPSSPSNNQRFGQDVSADGTTIAVGTLENIGAGRAYVFTGSGSSWAEQALVQPSDSQAGDRFGGAVALDGDRLVVGAMQSGAEGAAYVFERTGSTWSQTARLAGALAGDLFGWDVALDGDTLLVSAFGASGGAGAVHVFVRSGTTWQEQDVLLPTVAQDSSFGSALALDGETATSSARGETGVAQVYVFVRSGTTWDLQDRFGAGSVSNPPFASLTLSGDRLLVGTPGDGDRGRAALHVRSAGVWGLERTLEGVDPTVELGLAVALQDAEAFVLERPTDVYRFELDDVFASFCDADDGALALCPCANPGVPESGCDLPQSTGGVRLDVLAQERGPTNGATLATEGFPPQASPAAVLLRSRALDAGGPVVFGDGLRCVGPQVVRVGAAFGIGGAASFPIGHGGDTGAYYYQTWFRSLPAGFCTPDAFNLSNGRVLSW